MIGMLWAVIPGLGHIVVVFQCAVPDLSLNWVRACVGLSFHGPIVVAHI